MEKLNVNYAPGQDFRELFVVAVDSDKCTDTCAGVGETMQEPVNDPFYEILKKYDRLVPEYCLLKSDEAHQGFASHKEAVLFSMRKFAEDDGDITVDESKAAAVEVTAEELLSHPEKSREDRFGTTFVRRDFPRGGKIPYWYAFLEPPHGTGPVLEDGKLVRKAYGPEDFELVNRALFPEGTDMLEVYDWTTDWSNYFDAGREWWGTMCYSIYDQKMERYSVIVASSTD